MTKKIQPTKEVQLTQACMPEPAKDNVAQWYVYLLRCSDNSLYCGVTTNTARRTFEHNHCSKKAAKYTRARRPVSLVYQQQCNNKIDAYKKEYQLKRLNKQQKERLILNNDRTQKA